MEHFSSISNEKAEYFNNKLQTLLRNGIEIKEPIYFNKKKFSFEFLKNLTKFKVKKINFKELINKTKYNILNGVKIMDENIENQKILFNENLQNRKIKKNMPRRNSSRIQLNTQIDEFIRKFQIVYVTKLYPYNMEMVLHSFIKYDNNRIKITADFDDKIKEFEMLKLCEEGNFCFILDEDSIKSLEMLIQSLSVEKKISLLNCKSELDNNIIKINDENKQNDVSTESIIEQMIKSFMDNILEFFK